MKKRPDLTLRYPEVAEAARAYLRCQDPGYEAFDPEGFAHDTAHHVFSWTFDLDQDEPPYTRTEPVANAIARLQHQRKQLDAALAVLGAA